MNNQQKGIEKFKRTRNMTKWAARLIILAVLLILVGITALTLNGCAAPLM